MTDLEYFEKLLKIDLSNELNDKYINLLTADFCEWFCYKYNQKDYQRKQYIAMLKISLRAWHGCIVSIIENVEAN